MKKIAIVNQKGGTAKTTTAVNLAAALAEQGRKVLLVDIDPQGSATQWLGVKNPSKGLYTVFTENGSISDIITNTGIENLSLVPSSQWLIALDKALAGEVGSETILNQRLCALGAKWDYVLLDCPPALGLLSVNALTAATGVLIPVELHIMAIQGLAQLLGTIKTVRDRLNQSLSIDGIVACRVNKRTKLGQDILKDLRDRFGTTVCNTVIRETVKLAEAPSFCKPITTYDTKSAGAADYRKLAAEIIEGEANV